MSDDVKLVVLGNSGVGKTCLITKFVSESLKGTLDSTVGASYMTKILRVDNASMKFNIWDTAGQERFRSIVRVYYKDAAVAVLVYDLTNPESFRQLDWWYSELRNNVDYDLVIAVVANKEDLADNEKVTEEEAKAYAASIGALYFRTSAKSSAGVADLFCQIARAVLLRQATTTRKLSLTLEGNRCRQRPAKKGCC
jgi:small GTP-binding protein